MINELKSKKDLIDAFEAYNEMVYKYVYFRTFQNKELAEDLTQDTFMKAWINRIKFDNKRASLKTWLIIIARNSLIDYIRKNSRVINGVEDTIFESAINNDNKSENEVLLQFVLDNMKKLSDEDKELLTLRYVQQFEIEEIAEIINKSYNTTKVALFRALKKLKDLVND